MLVENNLYLPPDLNEPVNYKTLLIIITRLSKIALQNKNNSESLILFGSISNLLGALCHFENDANQRFLYKAYQNLQMNGEKIQRESGDNTLSSFTEGFKVSLDILSAHDMKYGEEWKAALKTKLKETRLTLQKKAKSTEIKLKTGSEPKGFVFFDEQQKVINGSSIRDSTSTIGFNREK